MTRVLAGSLFVAALATGCNYDRVGGRDFRIVPVCADSGRAPLRWALEYWQVESDLLPYAEPATDDGKPYDPDRHLKQYVATLQTIDDNRFSCPAYYHGTILFSPLWPFLHGWSRHSALVVYSMGYEWAIPRTSPLHGEEFFASRHNKMLAEIVAAESPEQKQAVQDRWVRQHGESVLSPTIPDDVSFALVEWDTATEQFDWYWKVLGDSKRFSRESRKWDRWSLSSDHRLAARYVMHWYVARYEAALRQEPALANDELPARHIATLRQRLGLDKVATR